MKKMPLDISRQAGIYVRRARERQGLTRDELAARSDISARSLASLELGDSKGIQLDKLLSVLHALGLGLEIVETKPDLPSQANPATNYSAPTVDAGQDDYDALLDEFLASSGPISTPSAQREGR